MSRGTKPWSPSPCTDGARRTTDDRTPCRASVMAASSDATRGRAGSGTSSSVPMPPGGTTPPSASPSVPDVTTNGLAEPTIVAPIASTARQVGPRRGRHVHEVVVVGQVDHTICSGGPAAQALEVVERAEGAPPHTGGWTGRPCSLTRARFETDHRWRRCQAGGAHGAHVLPALRRQTRGLFAGASSLEELLVTHCRQRALEPGAARCGSRRARSSRCAPRGTTTVRRKRSRHHCVERRASRTRADQARLTRRRRWPGRCAGGASGIRRRASPRRSRSRSSGSRSSAGSPSPSLRTWHSSSERHSRSSRQ